MDFVVGSGLRVVEWLTVEAGNLEHHYPHALKVEYRESFARIILSPRSNFLGSLKESN